MDVRKGLGLCLTLALVFLVVGNTNIVPSRVFLWSGMVLLVVSLGLAIVVISRALRNRG